MRHTSRYAAASALAAASVLAATAHPAAAQPKPTDWPAKPNTATSGAFSVVQLSTADPDKFMAEWRKPTAGVNLHGTNQIGRGRPITTFIAYRGCRADKAGKCHVTATFSLRSPAGKVDAYPPMEVSNPQLQPAPGIIYMSGQGLQRQRPRRRLYPQGRRHRPRRRRHPAHPADPYRLQLAPARRPPPLPRAARGRGQGEGGA